jgi:PadR family transcriptional regulator, phenolic acid-responsive transcriptional regulator
MIQKLIILGLLKKQPSTGYDIKKFIEKELGIFSKLETQSIYYPLKQLDKSGMVTKKVVTETKRPRHVYCITLKGQKEFERLSREALLSNRRPFIDIDIPLYFLPLLDKKKVLPLLRLRLRILQQVKTWLSAKQKELKNDPRNIQLLIQHHLKLAAAESEFLQAMVQTVKTGKTKG